ncbi:MAG: hypothetical protein WC919_04375 [Candidatus Paceibacterota bacterium]|jgi:hypothetical protein
MGCGACGGGSAARVMQKRAVGTQPRAKPAPAPISTPRMRPASTTRIVVATPSQSIKVKQQLRDLKTCPLCGSTLSPILSGSGVRNRKRCSRCNRTFI